jgi:hypothetical protein
VGLSGGHRSPGKAPSSWLTFLRIFFLPSVS